MAAVASRNPFALLGEEDSSPPATPAPAKKTPAVPAPAEKAKSTARTTPASRGGKYYARGGARASGDGNPNHEGVQEPVDGGKRFEGQGRGGRGGRGGRDARGGRGGGRPNPRLDRHSQTGRTDSEKQVNQGWGGEGGKAELKDESGAVADAATDAANEFAPASGADADAWGTTTAEASAWDASGDSKPAGEGKEDKPARRERTPEPEDNSVTYEQYLVEQKEKEALGVPQLETREVDADWKDVKPLEKEEVETYFVGKSKSSAPKTRAQSSAKESVEVNFAPPPRDTTRGGRGGDRGGRGGGRGRGGDRGDRGGARGRGASRGGARSSGSASQKAFNLDDQSAFPALG